MNIADVIVIAVLLAILAVIVYATRPKKGRTPAAAPVTVTAPAALPFPACMKIIRRIRNRNNI
ncbi:MAG: hypothetical protein ACLRL6_04635 [Clostridium sp.]